MAKKVKTKKKTLSKLELMKKRKIKLKESGGKNSMFFLSKPGTYRMRSVPVIPDTENAVEVIQFYLGPEIKGVISPASVGLPCALEENYQELIASDDEDDSEIASNMGRRSRFVMPHYRYKDSKGKEVDEDAGVRLLMMTKGQYDAWVDYFLEADEAGDPSDPIEGFDIKYKREGTGKMDTEYSLINCRPTKCHKAFRGPYDPEAMVKEIIPSYDETQDFWERFMGSSSESESVDDLTEDEEDDTRTRKLKARKKSKSTKKVVKKRKKK